MLSRAFSQVLGKGSKRPLDLLVHASSAVVGFGSNMPRHLHHLLPQPEPAASGAVGMSFEERFATLKSIGDCADQYELSLLLKRKTAPVCYVWCDPTPWMHITQGILMTANVNKMIKAGCKVKILMADWLPLLDHKISYIAGQSSTVAGGDLGKIRNIGLYNAETWKACSRHGSRWGRAGVAVRSNV
jgi:tyrosyl-tRNA synthetase